MVDVTLVKIDGIICLNMIQAGSEIKKQKMVVAGDGVSYRRISIFKCYIKSIVARTYLCNKALIIWLIAGKRK